jgi:hypothetical protein
MGMIFWCTTYDHAIKDLGEQFPNHKDLGEQSPNLMV